MRRLLPFVLLSLLCCTVALSPADAGRRRDKQPETEQARFLKELACALHEQRVAEAQRHFRQAADDGTPLVADGQNGLQFRRRHIAQEEGTGFI